MQVTYDRLFTMLRTEKEIEVFINPFVNAYLNDVMDQLEGQIASAKIAMARLSSPNCIMFYLAMISPWILIILKIQRSYAWAIIRRKSRYIVLYCRCM